MRTNLDDLAAINHYCFGGQRDFRDNFRVLVAGGGTGDALIFLAHQLRETNASIVYLDLSETATNMARARARVRGIEDNIDWIQGSLLDLPSMDLAPFDYINCSGVLHHLDEPPQGLQALKTVLKGNGALGVMLYGQYGRTGVYQMQDLMRLVNRNETNLSDMIRNTRSMIEMAPGTNWLKRHFGERPLSFNLDDAEVVDMFLHPRDRAYTVPQVYELLESVGLHLVDFTGDYRVFYDPRFAFRNPEIMERVKRLDQAKQQAAVEIFYGSAAKHAFWASAREDSQVDPLDPDNIPFFSQSALDDQIPQAILDANDRPWTMKIGPEGGLKIGVTIRPTSLTRQFIECIDGRRSTGQIVEAIAQTQQDEPSMANIWGTARQVLSVFQTCDLIFVRHPSVPEPGE